MWECLECGEEVDEDFDVCFNCGADRNGEPDPAFVHADDAGAFHDPARDTDPPLDDDPVADELAASIEHLKECYEAQSVTEAEFVAARLREEGIPAVADHHDNNTFLGGWRPTQWGYGPRVRVRPVDLERAVAWVGAYRAQRTSRPEGHS
jgi:hypothetical protein